jgi:hypothetical protein
MFKNRSDSSKKKATITKLVMPVVMIVTSALRNPASTAALSAASCSAMPETSTPELASAAESSAIFGVSRNCDDKNYLQVCHAL